MQPLNIKTPFAERSYQFASLILILLVPSILIAQSVQLESTNLPLIILDTYGEEIEEDARIMADMMVISNGSDLRNTPLDPPTDYEGLVSIEIRGASSASFPKKSYSFETQDGSGENLNIKLLGMPKENDWILYAPYSDKTLIRNKLAFKLSLDQGHYAPRSKYCELILNDDYVGIYVLMEKIKIDGDRVNITRLEVDDVEGDALTGGYILEVDRDDGDSGWSSLGGNNIYYHHPKADQLEPEQRAYIRDFITDLENSLSGLNYKEPVLGYRSWIDVETAIDYLLVQDLTKNSDAMRYSTYMYKDRDSKDGLLKLGPVWDFNIAFGNNNRPKWWSSTGWGRKNPLSPYLFWWDRLMSDSSFTEQYEMRWLQLRTTSWDLQSILNYIDSNAVLLDEAQQRNFERWPILDNKIFPNPQVYYTYEAEIEHLKQWITERIAWIDSNISTVYDPSGGDPDPFSKWGSLVVPNPFLELATIHFRIEESSYTELAIHNIRGQTISRLLDDQIPAGLHAVDWLAIDRNGRSVPSGVYLYTLRVNGKLEASGKLTRLPR